MAFLLNSLEETKRIASKLAARLKGGEVIFLVGELGSGKTSFVQFLASALGVEKKVKSPTFVIFQKYEGKNLNLYHFDLYRLREIGNSIDIHEIGLSEALDDPLGVVAIEWADLLEGKEIQEYLLMKFAISGEMKREIEIAAHGVKYKKLAEN